MATTKKLSEWEKERNFISKTLDPNKSMTLEEVEALPLDEIVGVHYESRIKFLKDNEYPVTRENMIADLSVKPE